ncbi:hypothetical protein SLEP1_g21621 [Rubroshorea leprosula]|uniref:Reverse transcriptase zinc-binding domain-containing protein n=1 Tax=Rubroshorea leprosula TaxID=152421 RepID=A0AAV5J6J0_9ROSI|nr:hypothetical protein SLEP1_g21621 [Rubroshorea leprosula]
MVLVWVVGRIGGILLGLGDGKGVCKMREVHFGGKSCGSYRDRWLRKGFVKVELEDTLRIVNIKQGELYYWAWKWDSSAHYTVKTTYQHLMPLQQTQLKGIFDLVWNCFVSLKVVALAWRALHDKLSTKINLARRDIIKDRRQTICSRCLENEETLSHLFCYCMQSWKVWASCYYWWGISSVFVQNINEHFKQHTGLIGNIKFIRGMDGDLVCSDMVHMASKESSNF